MLGREFRAELSRFLYCLKAARFTWIPHAENRAFCLTDVFWGRTMVKNSIRVLLVDPHPLVIAGIRSTLASTTDIEVCGESTTIAAVAQEINHTKPDVLLVGHALNGSNWRLLTNMQNPAGTRAAVLAMSSGYDSDVLCQSLRAGCRGIYDKADALSELKAAIRTIHAGGFWFRDADAHKVVESLLAYESVARRKFDTQLTERQQKIVSLVARGLTNLEIAEAVRVSQATVALDLTSIYKKCGVPDRVRLLVKVRGSRFTDDYALVERLGEKDPRSAMLAGDLRFDIAGN